MNYPRSFSRKRAKAIFNRQGGSAPSASPAFTPEVFEDQKHEK